MTRTQYIQLIKTEVVVTIIRVIDNLSFFLYLIIFINILQQVFAFLIGFLIIDV